MAIRIVIADDHSVVRRGLRMFLAMDPELVVVGEAADGYCLDGPLDASDGWYYCYYCDTE